MPHWLIASFLIPAGVFFAQTPGAQERRQGPMVDFAAVSAPGVPVIDLSAAEVEIRVDGRVRAIRTLRSVAAAPAGVRPGDPLSKSLRPYGSNSGRHMGRVFLLVVDEESFIAGREQPLRNAVEGLLVHLIPTDRVMLVLVPYGGVRLAMTAEHPRLRAAVAGIVGQRPRNETGSAMSCRTRLVLEALRDSLDPFRGASEPMNVLLFTAGLAGPRRDAPMARAPGMCELQPADFQRVTAAAGAARANVYLMHPDDLSANVSQSVEGIAGAGFTGSDNPLEGIEHLAGVTAAQRIPLVAAGNAALDRVARETASYYMAELEPDRTDTDGRSHPLSVRVNRRGVSVHARPEIAFPPVARTRATRLTAADMLLTAEGFPDLPVRAAAYTMERAGDGRLKIVAVADVLDRSSPIASAAAALIDTEGRVVARWGAPDAGESPLVGAMLAPPGSYRLRVAVVDAEGRTGAADYEFEARLTPVGPLALGSIVMGLSRDGVLIPRLEFGSEPSALASFEIAGGTAGAQVNAVLEVAHTPEGPALVTVPIALSHIGEQRFLAMGTVPLGALAAGDYVVRGVITLADGATGRVLAALRKR